MDIKHHGIKNLTQFAMEVIRSSGKEALSYYGKGNPDIKFDEDLVTEADSHLMEFFQNQLNSHFPEHQVFKNNQAGKDYTHDEKRYLWIFDPLDGVANFQAGIPIWGISLHLSRISGRFSVYFICRQPAIFFMHRPNKKLFWEKKKSTYLKKKRLTTKAFFSLTPASTAVIDPHSRVKSAIWDAPVLTYAMLPWVARKLPLLRTSRFRILLQPVLFSRRQEEKSARWMGVIFSLTNTWTVKRSMITFWSWLRIFIRKFVAVYMKFLRSGFKSSPQAQFLCWGEGFNTRNIAYIPAFESLGPP